MLPPPAEKLQNFFGVFLQFQIGVDTVFLREQAGKFVWESPIAGQPVNPSHFRDKYRNALFKVPGVRMLTPHSCRHTYVSQLQALGVDMETIQSMVGHADMEMTQHYLHVQEEVRQAVKSSFWYRSGIDGIGAKCGKSEFERKTRKKPQIFRFEAFSFTWFPCFLVEISGIEPLTS